MRRLGLGILLSTCWLLALSSAAYAQKRVALLIGNQSYTAEIGALVNPHNDVALLEKTLKGLDFEVVTVRDAGLAALHQAVNAYARRVRAAGPDAIAFFYYAGHGAADGGINYLIPVDVRSAEDVDLWDASLRLTEITGKLRKEAGNATHFVVLDACRNELKLRKAGTKALVQARGLARIEGQESGMLIAYATAEGELASDVGAGAGPYSRVLAEEIVKPGIEAVTMFRNVQRRVRLAIKQEPYLAFSALGDVYLAGHAVEKAKAAPPPQAHQSDADIKLLKEQLAKLQSDLKQQQERLDANSAKEKALKDALDKSQAELTRRQEEQRKKQESALHEMIRGSWWESRALLQRPEGSCGGFPWRFSIVGQNITWHLLSWNSAEELSHKVSVLSEAPLILRYHAGSGLRFDGTELHFDGDQLTVFHTFGRSKSLGCTLHRK